MLCLFFFLPLFTERAAKGDVFLHCSVEQPGLLGSVGHRVSVLAGCMMGNRGKQTSKNYTSCIHKALKSRSTDLQTSVFKVPQDYNWYNYLIKK